MSVKWMFIVVLGTLGMVRVSFPAFFNHWIRGQFHPLFDNRSSVGLHLLMWLVSGIFGGVSLLLLFPERPLWLLFAAVPMVLIGRMVLAFCLALLFRTKGSTVHLSSGFSFAASAMVYGWTAIGVLLTVILSDYLTAFSLWLFAAGHVVGLLWFARLAPAFQNLKDTGLRLYAILYLCALEVIPMYFIVNSHQ